MAAISIDNKSGQKVWQIVQLNKDIKILLNMSLNWNIGEKLLKHLKMSNTE